MTKEKGIEINYTIACMAMVMFIDCVYNDGKIIKSFMVTIEEASKRLYDIIPKSGIKIGDNHGKRN